MQKLFYFFSDNKVPIFQINLLSKRNEKRGGPASFKNVFLATECQDYKPEENRPGGGNYLHNIYTKGKWVIKHD